MEQNRMTSAEETSSIAKPCEDESGSVEGTDLVDELGPIPTFPPSALDPETGRMLPI